MERWRQVIGHDGYFLVDLRMALPEEGGRGRAVQSGYQAAWWLVAPDGERWLGSGPVDLCDGLRSIKPGATGPVMVRPMQPSVWTDVTPGAVLHLRERVGQTLGVACVRESVRVPDDAPLRLDAASLRPGAVLLQATTPRWWRRPRERRRPLRLLGWAITRPHRVTK